MIKILNCLISMLFCAVIVFGQSQNSSLEYNKYEVFAGYSANNLTSGNAEDVQSLNSTSTPTYRGWNASATYNFNRFIGLKADVSGHYKKFTFAETPLRVTANGSVYNYLGGIQIKDNKKSKRFSPFVHALVGVSTSKVKLNSATICSIVTNCQEKNSGFTMAIGGGVDLKVSERFLIRLIQADYNPTYFVGTRQNNVRLGFGVVFH
jgi:Outer membrane protein beta-barrel domain